MMVVLHIMFYMTRSEWNVSYITPFETSKARPGFNTIECPVLVTPVDQITVNKGVWWAPPKCQGKMYNFFRQSWRPCPLSTSIWDLWTSIMLGFSLFLSLGSCSKTCL